MIKEKTTIKQEIKFIRRNINKRNEIKTSNIFLKNNGKLKIYIIPKENINIIKFWNECCEIKYYLEFILQDILNDIELYNNPKKSKIVITFNNKVNLKEWY